MAAGYASISEQLFPSSPTAVCVPAVRQSDEMSLELLARVFRNDFGVLDLDSGCWLSRPHHLPEHVSEDLVELCREASTAGQAEVLVNDGFLTLLAVPIVGTSGKAARVALGAFVVRQDATRDDLCQAAQALHMAPGQTAAWAADQTPWAAEALRATGKLAIDHMVALERLDQAESESANLSVNLAATYEEISLLYRLTQNLKISETDEELGRIALEWMEDAISAEGSAIQLLPVAQDGDSLTNPGRTAATLLSFGNCPVDNEAFTRLVEHVGLGEAHRPIVVNCRPNDVDDWPFPEIRQLIAVPLVEGENLFGYLAAFNHVESGEFGTVEASLLSSVGAILGIHSGNIELYRQQAELLAGVVRALTSAIDAKDPYTCGHSDRVARVSVCLARELGCDAEQVKTIYLSGLLHDIGKIGIDDSVLRKPGSLTDEEYEHIKKHVKIGYRILTDLKKLDDVLPVVLHHHESWDGGGYPNRLPAEEIPLSARIVAVADSFDAMGSDRPYRKGLPNEKIDAIFRSGAGKQWDPAIIDAFFRRRDKIDRIMHDEREIEVVLPE